MDDTCKSFISGFLERDASKRLGQNDIADFADHKFFEGFSWTEIRARTAKPPFKPVIHGQVGCLHYYN